MRLERKEPLSGLFELRTFAVSSSYATFSKAPHVTVPLAAALGRFALGSILIHLSVVDIDRSGQLDISNDARIPYTRSTLIRRSECPQKDKPERTRAWSKPKGL